MGRLALKNKNENLNPRTNRYSIMASDHYIGAFDVLSHFRNAERCGSYRHLTKWCVYIWK